MGGQHLYTVAAAKKPDSANCLNFMSLLPANNAVSLFLCPILTYSKSTKHMLTIACIWYSYHMGMSRSHI